MSLKYCAALALRRIQFCENVTPLEMFANYQSTASVNKEVGLMEPFNVNALPHLWVYMYTFTRPQDNCTIFLKSSHLKLSSEISQLRLPQFSDGSVCKFQMALRS